MGLESSENESNVYQKYGGAAAAGAGTCGDGSGYGAGGGGVEGGGNSS